MRLLLLLSLLLGCARSETRVSGPARTEQVAIDAGSVDHSVTRALLGQAVFYPEQAYAWDPTLRRTPPQAMELFKELGMGMVGHYPGIGVVTHDFMWKNMIGPLAERKDPTPRTSLFDTPRHLEFGPDEYGRFLEEYRLATGHPAEGSIQVNIVNGTAEDAADWVEYMNVPNDGSNPGGGVDWAAVRAKNGHPEPYRIRYWEMGNEPHFTAMKVGQLTAAQYVARIREFVPLMKARDPSIRVMAYVNPFYLGDPKRIGLATPDIDAAPGLTWSQAVIRETGALIDHVYFHWYGGWNDRVHDYQFVATSMRRGLVPWLDRLLADVDKFAPSEAVRTRLKQVFIPEWNVVGGWTRPLSKATALQGATAYSRTLHVFAARKEIQAAQHFALACPYPGPRSVGSLLFDVRDGYFTVRSNLAGTDFMPTALHPVARLWSRAFESEVVRASASGLGSAFSDGTPDLDVTALRSPDRRRLSVIVTNAGALPRTLTVALTHFVANPQAVRLTVTGADLAMNNDWEHRARIVMKESPLAVGPSGLTLTVPPRAVEAVLMERAS